MTPAVDALVAAIEQALAECDETGGNFPDLLSAAITTVAERHGSFRLVEHRPGSWEAQHVAALDLLHRDVAL